MTAVDRALRYIEKLMASRPVRAASAKATPRPTQRRGKRPEPAQRPAREPYVPPVTQPDVSALVETFAPAAPVSVEWAMGGGVFVYRAGVILPNGELLDDVLGVT